MYRSLHHRSGDASGKLKYRTTTVYGLNIFPKHVTNPSLSLSFFHRLWSLPVRYAGMWVPYKCCMYSSYIYIYVGVWRCLSIHACLSLFGCLWTYYLNLCVCYGVLRFLSHLQIQFSGIIVFFLIICCVCLVVQAFFFWLRIFLHLYGWVEA